MQTRMTCSTCMAQWSAEGIDDHEVARRLSGYWATVTNQGICEWTCPQGHTVRFIFQTPFYALLFLKGETDLARKDTRSATLSFYSAWDNFVAFTCDMLLSEAGVSDKLPINVRRAEPLLGMFVGLVAARTGKLPVLVGTDIANIRNEVIHGERIPTEDDALKVGVAVQKAIADARQRVPEFDAKEVKASVARFLKRVHGTEPGSQVGLTMIGVSPDFDGELAARIEAIRKEREGEER